MSRTLICTAELDETFPISIQALYNGKSLGRYSWLTKTRPDGQPSQRLWIDVRGFNEWAMQRGLAYRLGAARERSWER